MTWKREELKAAIKEDTQTIREVKSRQRESGQPRWSNGLDDWHLMKLKKQATLHCALAAHIRGRVHLPGSTAEEQQDLIQPIIEKFTRPSGETADTADSNPAAA